MIRASSAVVLFAVVVCAAGVVRAQIAGQVASGAAPGSQAAMKVYTNPALHLTFSYPAELGPRDATAVAAVGRRMMLGEDTSPDQDQQSPGQESPGQQKSSGTCMKVLLSVGKDGSGGQESIALFDMDVRCLPAKALRNKKAMDNLLTILTTQGTTALGMMPIEEPMFYEIQGHRVRFAAAQGTPVTKGDLQNSDAQEIAVAATAVSGHVLSWWIQAGDVATYNRLLRSQVDFGAGKAQALFPAGFQE
jgi:hypothetical protein